MQFRYFVQGNFFFSSLRHLHARVASLIPQTPLPYPGILSTAYVQCHAIPWDTLPYPHPPMPFSPLKQSSTYRYREFPVSGIFHFLGGIGTGIGKNLYRKKVSVPVSEKFGTVTKYRNRYRKNLVPEKSIGTGIGKIWYRKKSWNWNLNKT